MSEPNLIFSVLNWATLGGTGQSGWLAFIAIYVLWTGGPSGVANGTPIPALEGALLSAALTYEPLWLLQHLNSHPILQACLSVALVVWALAFLARFGVLGITVLLSSVFFLLGGHWLLDKLRLARP